MEEWHDHTGFEFIGKEEVDKDDHKHFLELWERNVAWLQDVVNEMSRYSDLYIGYLNL